MAHSHSHTHDHSGLSVEVERTGPCLATVRFNVSAEEHRRSRQQGLMNLARQTRLKGFRPGKVPPQMLEKQFGEQVDQQLVEHFCQHALEKAIRDSELRPAASPRIDLASVTADPEAGWGHEFEILLRPDIELGTIEGLSVEGQSVDVTDEEVQLALEDVRRQLSVPEPAGDDGMPEDGVSVCKVSFAESEGADALLEREGIRITPATPPPGVEEEAFKEAMVGAKDGETRTFDVEFPEDFPSEEVRGKKGICTVEVTEAYRVVAPTEERVREEFSVEDDDALLAEIRERIGVQKRQQENGRIEHELLERLIREHPMELPEPLVEDQADARVAEMRAELEKQELDEAEIEPRLAAEREEALQGARRTMAAIYLMEEIAKQKGLQVTEKNLKDEFQAIAARNGVDVGEVRKYYQEERLLQQLALELLERNVRGFLREKAEIKEVASAD